MYSPFDSSLYHTQLHKTHQWPELSTKSLNFNPVQGNTDSVYWQQKLQAIFYNKLGEKGVYVNQPDRYFYQGGSRTGLF